MTGHGGAHEVHRELIALIADTPKLVAQLIAAGRLPHADWRRHTSRLQPDPGVWAHVVLESPSFPATRVHWSSPPETFDVTAAAAVTPIVDDDTIPGLAGVLDAVGDHELLRYRPGRRCTLRGTLDGAGASGIPSAYSPKPMSRCPSP